MSRDDDAKRILQLVRDLAREEADMLHVGCAACGLETCLGGPTCRCPAERVGVAIAWLPGVYLHAGTCLSRFADDPRCIGAACFNDTRISGRVLN